MTQTDLAKSAGVAQQTITRLANNQRKRFDPAILQPIADTFTNALGRVITIDDLIEKDNLTEKPESTQRPDTLPEPLSIEDKIDHLSQQVASVRGEIADMRQDVNQQIADVRNEIGKLNRHEK